MEEEGGTVHAERSEAARSTDRKVVYADHPFMVLVRKRRSPAFHLFGAFKRPQGRVQGHDELWRVADWAGWTKSQFRKR